MNRWSERVETINKTSLQVDLKNPPDESNMILYKDPMDIPHFNSQQIKSKNQGTKQN